jgi:hypothetical protein
MYRDKVASLMQELERVLEHERSINDVAPLGSGFHQIVIGGDEDVQRVSASPAAQRVHDLVTQVLEHCPGSKGLKRSITKSTDAFFLAQLPTVVILVPLRSPDIYDAEKVQAYERGYWSDRCRSIRSALDDGTSIIEELFSWAMDYAEHYKERAE